jgi:hypothetical protein
MGDLAIATMDWRIEWDVEQCDGCRFVFKVRDHFLLFVREI